MKVNDSIFKFICKETFSDLHFPAVSTKCIHYLKIMNSKGYGNYETLSEDTEKKEPSFSKTVFVTSTITNGLLSFFKSHVAVFD